DHPDPGAEPAGRTRPDRRVRPPLPRPGAAAQDLRLSMAGGGGSALDGLPVILLPVAVDDGMLDACLAALDAGTPAGTRVWLADDAQAGPRALAIIERWLATTPLRAEYSRRQRRLGEVAHLDEALAACGDADVIVLAPDAVPGPG